MSITVKGDHLTPTKTYPVDAPQGSIVKIMFGPADVRIKKRNKNESDRAMEARINEQVKEFRKVICASSTLTCFQLHLIDPLLLDNFCCPLSGT